jgi:hypothetical protein
MFWRQLGCLIVGELIQAYFLDGDYSPTGDIMLCVVCIKIHGSYPSYAY